MPALAAVAGAQTDVGGVPFSATNALAPEVSTVRFPALASSRIAQEDELQPKGTPLRFGIAHEVDLSLDNAGTWESSEGGRVWRLRLLCEGASSISLVFARWQLPAGADLYVYDDDRETVLGGYTYRNNKPNGRMAIQPLPAEAITLEYYEPSGVDAPGELAIQSVVHGYRDIGFKSGSSGSQGGCIHDVRCPQGAGYERGVEATVQVLAGGSLCTGSFLNNTARDGAQLLMSANHCGDLDDAVFRFQYERPLCGNGNAPTDRTVQGSVRIASDAARDFNLVRVVPPIPPAYGAYFAGWDRRDAPATATHCIHHPLGFPKAISFDDDPPVRVGVYWNVAAWDLGVTEPGSSGAPLYSAAGHFLGQLCCGDATCGQPRNDNFGALVDAWPLVRGALDPLGTGELVLEGYDPTPTPTDAPILAAVIPEPLAPLHPGTGAIATVFGDHFTDDTTLAVDGVPLAGEVTFVDARTMSFDPPELSLGDHVLSATNGQGSASLTFRVDVPSEPRLQAVFGDAGDPLFSTNGPLVHSGTPATVHVLLGSLSPQASPAPGIVDLALGNAFQELHTLGAVVIGGDGLARGQLLLPGGPGLRGQTIYLQTVEVSRPVRFPLPVSNRQEPQFQF